MGRLCVWRAGMWLCTLALWLGPAMPPIEGSPAHPQYQVYAVRYAILPQFPLAALVAGADRTKKLDIAMMIWVARGPTRVVLIDAGFYRPAFVSRWKPVQYVRPDRALAPLGISPDAVTDVIVTHAHWDHLDGADLFPRARVWIQRAEYDYYRVPAHQTRTGVFAEDIAMLEQIQRQHRLELVDGDRNELLPGIAVFLGARHTYASQFVVVQSADGPVVLASDNAYLFENLEANIPIAQTLDPAACLASFARMHQLAGPKGVIVPGHDPDVFVRYPKLAPGIARVR
jgi:glyoxylase-like metal-dependent hydrolase (beta-lactamase superfamily II)